MIKGENIKFDYIRRDENDEVIGLQTAINDISFEINAGDFVAILGHNGSGKSTLAKHINALLVPEEGVLYVDGIDTSEEEMIWEIRQRVGMVFQNPDNQFVYSVIEDDVGFGPENLGIEPSEIKKRVKNALDKVGLSRIKKKSPDKLSGGQKQKVAIAGMLAMKPKCIVLDEATAMLDPVSRKEVLDACIELNKNENITILWITHHMDEVTKADKVIVMNEGNIVMEGTPKAIFSDVDKLKEYKLDVPQVTMLAYELKKAGLEFPAGIITIDEFVEVCDGIISKRA